jgi:hypothetical protein
MYFTANTRLAFNHAPILQTVNINVNTYCMYAFVCPVLPPWVGGVRGFYYLESVCRRRLGVTEASGGGTEGGGGVP